MSPGFVVIPTEKGSIPLAKGISTDDTRGYDRFSSPNVAFSFGLKERDELFSKFDASRLLREGRLP